MLTHLVATNTTVSGHEASFIIPKYLFHIDVI